MRTSLLKGLVLLLFVAPATLEAQASYAIDEGSLVLGGTVSWSTSGGDLYENVDGDRYSSIVLNPRVLYFVIPGLAVGGDVFVQSASQGDVDATTIAVGPSVAYFFGGPDSRVYPYINAFVGYGKTSAGAFDASGLTFGTGVGAAFMMSRSVALTAGGTYRVENLSVEDVDESFGGNSFALQLGVEAFLF